MAQGSFSGDLGGIDVVEVHALSRGPCLEGACRICFAGYDALHRRSSGTTQRPIEVVSDDPEGPKYLNTGLSVFPYWQS